MTHLEIEKEVVSAVSQVLKKPVETITMQTSFAQLGADELDMFELVIKFEDLFALEISDDAACELDSVHKVVQFVVAQQQAAQQAV